jgi:hypothetical protein
LNRTTIRVLEGFVQVRHGPLPWSGNRALIARNIQQLFCVESKHVQKSWVRYTYDVIAWNQDDTQDVLVAGIDDEQQALLIEREIERHLSLTKRKERVPPGFRRRESRKAG